MMHIGRVCEITRYPVKSMAGVTTDLAMIGWHGITGDRRFAFRRLHDQSGFPWLSASRLPELVCYQPVGLDDRGGEPLPTHVRTPTGSQLELRSLELRAEISERLGGEVELMNLKHGIFDEAPISVISLATIAAIGSEAGMDGLDRRRFRMNIVIEPEHPEAFAEDTWIGGTLMFGDDSAGNPAVRVTMPDERCVMVNVDPDTAAKDARIMKTVTRLNQNNAGVYATVIRTGPVRVSDRVYLDQEN
ncbi:MAG TPA: MOSC domain-containing protein [Pyrinomonadaceae bacterium]|nr:MOSC domain-containing protein [Pyrinomonadaceae bacterium]